MMNTAHTDGLERDSADARSSFSMGGLMWRVGVALLFYVLSTGPVVKLLLEGRISEKAVETIYAPFVWLDNTQFGERVLGPFFRWYGETIWRWEVPAK
jgi:hypothetical protein